MEVDRRTMDGAKSAVSQGWLFALSSYTITLKMLQAPEALCSRKATFDYFFVVLKVTPPEGHVVFGLFKNEAPAGKSC